MKLVFTVRHVLAVSYYALRRCRRNSRHPRAWIPLDNTGYEPIYDSPVSGYRFVLLAVLLWVGADFSMPTLPGAFVFDAEESVDGVRARGGPEVQVTFVHDTSPAPPPRVAIGNRWRVGHRPFMTSSLLSVNVLPRAALVLIPPSEDPH